MIWERKFQAYDSTIFSKIRNWASVYRQTFKLNKLLFISKACIGIFNETIKNEEVKLFWVYVVLEMFTSEVKFNLWELESKTLGTEHQHSDN